MGISVILTMAIVWMPFLRNAEITKSVIMRLFPFNRGVFEDYVANFWCMTSPLFKWKLILSEHKLIYLCAIITLITCSISMVHQLLKPSKIGFIYSLANSSLAFYLFSYQVSYTFMISLILMLIGT